MRDQGNQSPATVASLPYAPGNLQRFREHSCTLGLPKIRDQSTERRALKVLIPDRLSNLQSITEQVFGQVWCDYLNGKTTLPMFPARSGGLQHLTKQGSALGLWQIWN
jgi:hypothetical protein